MVVRVASSRKKSRHGTLSGYTGGCRCDPCRAAKKKSNTSPEMKASRERSQKKARERAAKDPGLITHGIPSGYTYWGCCCDLCYATVKRPPQNKVAEKIAERVPHMIIRHSLEGASLAAIAEEEGISYNTVRRWFDRAGYVFRRQKKPLITI